LKKKTKEAKKISFRRKKTTTDKKINELQNALKEAIIKAEKLSKEIENLTEECAKCTTDTDELNSQIAKLDRNIAKTDASVQELQDKVRDKKSESTKLEKQKEYPCDN